MVRTVAEPQHCIIGSEIGRGQSETGGDPVKISGVLSGVAGEYFVAAELSRQGLIASITLRNTKGIDILASNSDASRQVGIQVKTNQSGRTGWVLNRKAEDYFAENLFYVFVNLREANGRPDFYVVPSTVVAKVVKEGHREWLATPGRRGQKHSNTSMRMFRDPHGKYLERWDLLELSKQPPEERPGST